MAELLGQMKYIMEICLRLKKIRLPAAVRDGFSFLSLIDTFDKTTGQAFTDGCHLAPEGNRIVAERVFDLIEESLIAEATAAKIKN